MGADLLGPPPGRGRAGYPDTRDQLGFADVQRRNPLDDLLAVLGLLHHPVLQLPTRANRAAARRSYQGMANLIRVLEATLKGPRRSSQRPTRSRPRTDQARTASAGDQHRFSARNGPPTRANDDSVSSLQTSLTTVLMVGVRLGAEADTL